MPLHADLLLFTVNDSNFAECPLFEPYAPKKQQHQQQRRNTITHNTTTATAASTISTSVSSGVLQERGLQESKQEPLRCWRLPSRYNGDWPLLFVDGAIQRTQHSLSSAPADWVRLKKVKVSVYLYCLFLQIVLFIDELYSTAKMYYTVFGSCEQYCDDSTARSHGSLHALVRHSSPLAKQCALRTALSDWLTE
jgi:hypothetical protein